MASLGLALIGTVLVAVVLDRRVRMETFMPTVQWTVPLPRKTSMVKKDINGQLPVR